MLAPCWRGWGPELVQRAIIREALKGTVEHLESR